jgi:two-component system NarL family response regulator
MSQSTTIRVLIVDDHSIVRQGLATIINRDSEMTVIAQAEDRQQAIDFFGECQPANGSWRCSVWSRRERVIWK